MARQLTGVLGLILFVILFTGMAYSQEVILSCASLNLDREIKTFNVPVNLSNTSPIGGITITFITGETDPPFIIKPVNIDRSNGRIANWEYFNFTFSEEDSSRVRVVAIPNMPGGGNPPALPPGEGLLFNIKYEFSCDFAIDTALSIAIVTADFSDSTGYILYNADLNHGSVTIGDDTALRGDANCDGQVIGSDITYLVSYLDNMVGCTCSLRAGDANNDGEVNIADVVYLKRFFNAEGPPPEQ